ncbi:MAG TPA: hypothetical protein VNM48_04305 [Chloroflexota bacterium]|nr:hypothetical protein [Chloroflexota bacterium]
MQFIQHNDEDGTVLVYHTHSRLAGSDGFECFGRVKVADLGYGQDPTTRVGEDPNVLLVECPKCGAPGSVSVFADGEAQRLHARKRLADPKHPAQTLSDAIESVLADVEKRNGVPSMELAIEGIEAMDGKPDAKAQPALAGIKDALEQQASEAAALMADGT